MKIMCDTNVIIDVLLEREPFVENSCSVLSLCEGHKIDGFVPASSLTFIYYLIKKHIQNNIPKDYLICIILGMTAKVLVAELTDMGYMAWDVGHLAKDYDVFMRKVEKTEDNRAEFWKPD